MEKSRIGRNFCSEKKMSEISAPKKKFFQKSVVCHELFSHISAVVEHRITYDGLGTTLLWIFILLLYYFLYFDYLLSY